MTNIFKWLAGLMLAAFVLGAPQLAAARTMSPAHHSDTRWVQMVHHMHKDHVTMKRAWHLPVGFLVTNPDGKKAPLTKGETYYSRYFGPSLKQQLATMTVDRDAWRKLANDRGATIGTLNRTVDGLKTTVGERDTTISAKDKEIASIQSNLNWTRGVLTFIVLAIAGLIGYAILTGGKKRGRKASATTAERETPADESDAPVPASSRTGSLREV